MVLAGFASIDRDPITHGRQVGIGRGFVPEFAGHHGGDFFSAFQHGPEIDAGFPEQTRGDPAVFA